MDAVMDVLVSADSCEKRVRVPPATATVLSTVMLDEGLTRPVARGKRSAIMFVLYEVVL